MQHVPGDQGLEDVELEVALEPADGDGHLVAHHLGAGHCDSLALGWVDLPWHYTGSWLVLGQDQLAQTTPWPTAQESDVVGDLGEADSNAVQSTMEIH